MAGGREEIAAILRREHVFAARAHPSLARTARRMADEGLLVAVTRGVWASATEALSPEVRILAAVTAFPDAVVTGAAAARLTFWPGRTVDQITLANGRTRRDDRGLTLSQERIPPELIMPRWGVPVTVPALTALDLLGPGIDQALLRRAATLAEMHSALELTAGRAGNADRRRLLHDSRDEPWSEAERVSHAILRHAGLTGFTTNLEVRCGTESFFVDVAFRGPRVAIEIDGWETHRHRDQFERDRRKQTMLAARGWRVLRVTWQQLVSDPEWFVEQVRLTLRLAA